MGGDAPDPLLLGQRVVAILETGLRMGFWFFGVWIPL